MVAFEKYCEEQKPDLVMVVGDVNSTLACSIVAKKLNIKVAHVEAGLRSGDMQMPEEINRMVTDAISDYFFVTEPSGVENLRREGHSEDSIHFVGHVMIDNLFYQLEQLKQMDTHAFSTQALKDRLGKYGVVTLHRPSNVDDQATLTKIISALSVVSNSLPLVFAIHPRTARNLESFGLVLPDSIICTEPLPYMDFLNLWRDAVLILTDSGGIQEESTALGIPCITMRENTERPVTVTEGSNRLVGTDAAKIIDTAHEFLQGATQIQRKRPQLWDGQAAGRIIETLLKQSVG